MRSRRLLKSEINVVPYIDVMLVLLVIFMVVTPMMTTGSVDLPTTGKSSQIPTNPTRVLVKADGSLMLKDDKGRDTPLDKTSLIHYLRKEKMRNPELAVLVAGDKNARYEAVLNVLDSIKQLDIQRVGLETVRQP